MSVHHSGPNKFQKQVQRVLEFVVYPRRPDGSKHSSRQRRMDVGINKEPNPKHVPVSHTKTLEWEGGLPSQFQETPNHIGDSLILLLQVPGVLDLGARRKLFSSSRTQTQSEIDSRRLSLGTPISPDGRMRDQRLTFCLRNSSSTSAEGTIHPPTRSTSCEVWGELWATSAFVWWVGLVGCSNQK